MRWVGLIFVAIAAACWLSAAVHGFWSLAHLSGRRTVGAMLVRGFEWFKSENFTERGKQLQRRFVYSFALFALFAMAGLALYAAGTEG